MKQILVVGAGGIGSYLAEHLSELCFSEQITDAIFTFADDDFVEVKNVKYQNYDEDDVMEQKVDILAEKYGFGSIPERIKTRGHLLKYDCVISAVDNKKFRKLMFKEAADWIDLRSEGRSVAFFTKCKTNTTKKMIESLGEIEEDEESGSCQLAYELKDNIIQLGNRIIAQIGAQLILNYTRNDKNKPSLVFSF